MASEINSNYQRVLERIGVAARAAGREAADVRLVVVTKGHPLQSVEQAIEAGAHDLGENYVEEGVEKIMACSGWEGLKWHMIGHIQSRKAQPVCEHFDWVHSLDSLKLARRLDRFAGEAGRKLPVLLECNISGEESKFGWRAAQEENWPDLLEDLFQVVSLPNLQVRGLMAMAPFLPEPEETRPYFQRLARLRSFLAERIIQADWSELSMGMSSDFEVAIQEGATLVRIGSAILGPRPAD